MTTTMKNQVIVQESNMAQGYCETLPEDIWRQIFELCGDGNVYFPTVKREHRGVFILATVCSSWRHIVLDMPALWRKFVLTRRLRSDALEDVRMLLARGRQMPRSLTLLTRKRPVFPTLIHDLIAPYQYQRLVLSLHPEEVESFAELLTCNPRWISGLQELTLLRCHKSQFTPFRLFPPEAQLSELSSLQLKVYQTINFQFLEHANLWHKMRHLHMSTKIPARYALFILCSCLNLEVCHLVSDVDDSFTVYTARSTPLSTIALPNLRSLTVTFYGGYDVSPFIRSLAVPGLVSLSLFTPYNEEVYLHCDASLFVQLALHSGGLPNIQTLRIDRAEDPLDLDIILRAMPSLNEIMLDPLSSLEETTMNEIITGRLGARLESLYVRTIDDDDDVLLHMMEQHRNSFARERHGPDKVTPLHLEVLTT
ncbi:hypothetical protein AX15_005742 [Amanita polypyramis BW_CC]|nr:hypothetical protein AX15_005742 [Amanita polypyramis BW_CC]